MRRFKLNKLIRDRVLADMVAHGQQVKHRRLNGAEFLYQLTRKLQEETAEFTVNDPKALAELTDILEVVEALGQELGKSFGELRALQAERRQDRGGFAERIFIEHVTLKDDDPWATYYAKEPNRFKEITRE